MPSLGADMESGVLVEWLKKPGDEVHRGDVIAEVETEKGVIEVEVFEDGIVDELIAEEGERAAVGAPLAKIRAPGEEAAEPEKEEEKKKAREEKPAKARPGAREPTRRRISPAARRHAEELGVDLDRVTGSGPDGAVIVEDVEKAAQEAKPAEKPAEKPKEKPPEKEKKKAAVDLEAMRDAIGAAMARSNREIPHYYVATTIDMTPVLNWLEAFNKDRSPAERMLPVVPVMKAAAHCLRDVPQLNGHYVDGEHKQPETVDLGAAVALRGGGLVAPAIFEADLLSLEGLMTKLRDLTGRVRAGRMRQTELTGASFTVTSLGEGGVESMMPIISPPQVGILALGSIVERPWVVDGMIGPRQVMHVTLAGDHRASDGRHGARFLEKLTRYLEDPERL